MTTQTSVWLHIKSPYNADVENITSHNEDGRGKIVPIQTHQKKKYALIPLCLKPRVTGNVLHSGTYTFRVASRKHKNFLTWETPLVKKGTAPMIEVKTCEGVPVGGCNINHEIVKIPENPWYTLLIRVGTGVNGQPTNYNFTLRTNADPKNYNTTGGTKNTYQLVFQVYVQNDWVECSDYFYFKLEGQKRKNSAGESENKKCKTIKSDQSQQVDTYNFDSFFNHIFASYRSCATEEVLQTFKDEYLPELTNIREKIIREINARVFGVNNGENETDDPDEDSEKSDDKQRIAELETFICENTTNFFDYLSELTDGSESLSDWQYNK